MQTDKTKKKKKLPIVINLRNYTVLFQLEQERLLIHIFEILRLSTIQGKHIFTF